MILILIGLEVFLFTVYGDIYHYPCKDLKVFLSTPFCSLHTLYS
jgi:hypothetical protein